MPIILFAVILPFAFLLSFYFYKRISNAVSFFAKKEIKRTTKILLGAVSFAVAFLPVLISGILLSLLIYILLFSLLIDLCNLIIKFLFKQRYHSGFIGWKKCYYSFLVPVILSASMIAYGYANMNNVVKTEYTVFTDKDIRQDGYRIVLVSDVHFGISLNREELTDKIEEISSTDPDILVLCGDVVDDSTSKEDAIFAFQAFSKINTTFGAYYVYGNHDRQLYKTERAYDEAELEKIISDSGITILQDETADILNEVLIIGREDKSYKSIDRKNLEELKGNIGDDSFILVLDHQPTAYEENIGADIDLVLSGHTHNGQLWPFNWILNIVKFNDGVYGLYELDSGTTAIVTSGFAGWGFPIKTSAPAEYVVIDIKPR